MKIQTTFETKTLLESYGGGFLLDLRGEVEVKVTWILIYFLDNICPGKRIDGNLLVDWKKQTSCNCRGCSGPYAGLRFLRNTNYSSYLYLITEGLNLLHQGLYFGVIRSVSLAQLCIGK